MKDYISPALIREVNSLVEKGISPSSIKKVISNKTGFKKTKSNQIFHSIINGEITPDQSIEKTEWSQSLTGDLAPYYFNPQTNQYVVFIKNLGRNIVVSKEQHESILKSYSNWDGEERSIAEICRVIQWPRAVLTEYLSKFNIKHDSLPVSDIDFEEKSEEQIVQELLEAKKFSVYQKFEKQSWDAIREDAKKWSFFEHKHYKPFLSFLEKFEPKPITQIKSKYNNENGDKVFLVGLSDIHFGIDTKSRYIYNKEINNGNWTIEDTSKAVDKYSEDIRNCINSRKYTFEKAVICILGDLLHSLTGFTEKGTKIEAYPLGEEQYDLAFNSLILFISRMVEIFNKCEIYAVSGNHSLMDNLLVRSLAIYFRNDSRVSFQVTDARFLTFKIYDTVFITEHGASAYYKSKVPRSGKPLEAYIQQLFLARPDLLVGSNSRVFLMGDIHTFKAEELGYMERYVFGTLSGNDKYADHNNWTNRPRQNCLVVGRNGVEEILNFYLQ